MMFHSHGPRNHCSLLAVFCDKTYENKQKQPVFDDEPRYTVPKLASSGHLEVRVLTSPSVDEFQSVLQSLDPSIVYLQGEQIEDREEIGSLRWGDVDFDTSDALCGLFGSTLPATGVPYVIYWKSSFASFAALHFRQALFAVVQSSCGHISDAFHLAYASFQLCCIQNNAVASNIQKPSSKPGPWLLGDPPKINIAMPEADDEHEEGSSEALPAVKIYDDDVTMRFLVCGLPCTLLP